MGNSELDQHILAACEPRWLKVARVITQAAKTTGLHGKEWGYKALAKRIRRLVKKGDLQAAGNLWSWRSSEVRLPPSDETNL